MQKNEKETYFSLAFGYLKGFYGLAQLAQSYLCNADESINADESMHDHNTQLEIEISKGLLTQGYVHKEENEDDIFVPTDLQHLIEEFYFNGLNEGLNYYWGLDNHSISYEKAFAFFHATSDRDPITRTYEGICYLEGKGIAKNKEKGIQIIKNELKNLDDLAKNHKDRAAESCSCYAQYLLIENESIDLKEEELAKKYISLYNNYVQDYNDKFVKFDPVTFYKADPVTFFYTLYTYDYNHSSRQEFKKQIKSLVDSSNLPEANFFYSKYIIDQKEDSFQYCKKAAEKNHDHALYQLGRMYFYGYGTRQNNEKAVECLKQSYKQGNYKAAYFLAYMYTNGLGIKKNYGLAWNYLRNAYQFMDDQEVSLPCLDFDLDRLKMQILQILQGPLTDGYIRENGHNLFASMDLQNKNLIKEYIYTNNWVARVYTQENLEVTTVGTTLFSPNNRSQSNQQSDNTPQNDLSSSIEAPSFGR